MVKVNLIKKQLSNGSLSCFLGGGGKRMGEVVLLLCGEHGTFFSDGARFPFKDDACAGVNIVTCLCLSQILVNFLLFMSGNGHRGRRARDEIGDSGANSRYGRLEPGEACSRHFSEEAW